MTLWQPSPLRNPHPKVAQPSWLREMPFLSEFNSQPKSDSVSQLFFGSPMNSHPATNSMRTFFPNALAAFVSVESVTDLHSGSSKRSSAARDVPIALASAAFFSPRSAMMSASCKATTRFSAANSTSSWIPSSVRKSPKLLPRCGFFFLAVLDVIIFSFQSQRPVLSWCFLCFLDKAVQQNDLLVVNKKERPGDTRRQSASDFPKTIAKTIHQGHSQRPSILKHLQVFTDHFAFFGQQLLQPRSNRFVATSGTKKDHWQRSLRSHSTNCIYFDTFFKLIH